MKHTNTVHEQVSALADGHLRGDEFAQVVDKVCSRRRVARDLAHLSRGRRRACARACTPPAATPRRFLAGSSSAWRRSRPHRRSGCPRREARACASGRGGQRAGVPLEAAWPARHRWPPRRPSAGTGLAAPARQPAGAQLAQQQQAESGARCVGSVAADRRRRSRRRGSCVGNGNPQVMLRDPRLDQLLEAHQQAGGASQMPSGFLRNATFEGQSR